MALFKKNAYQAIIQFQRQFLKNVWTYETVQDCTAGNSCCSSSSSPFLLNMMIAAIKTRSLIWTSLSYHPSYIWTFFRTFQTSSSVSTSKAWTIGLKLTIGFCVCWHRPQCDGRCWNVVHCGGGCQSRNCWIGGLRRGYGVRRGHLAIFGL